MRHREGSRLPPRSYKKHILTSGLTPDILQSIPRLLAYLSSLVSCLFSRSRHLDLSLVRAILLLPALTLGASLPFSLLAVSCRSTSLSMPNLLASGTQCEGESSYPLTVLCVSMRFSCGIISCFFYGYSLSRPLT